MEGDQTVDRESNSVCRAVIKRRIFCGDESHERFYLKSAARPRGLLQTTAIDSAFLVTKGQLSTPMYRGLLFVELPPFEEGW
ncbi:MAG: hypothetical protein ACXWUI_13545, partial [Burkholderiales bacterium]